MCTGYVLLTNNTLAAAHLAYPDVALDKFYGTDRDKDVESFVQLID